MTNATDVLLHPVRLRIVQALAGRTLTVSALRAALPDVPQATLYRHVKTLEQSGLLKVVAESRAGGAVERTFALDREVGQATESELKNLDRAGLERLFGAFTAALMADFRRVLDAGDVDLEERGIGFRTYPMMLTDAELAELSGELREVLLRYLDRPAAPGRRRRKLSLVFLPGEHNPPGDDR